MNFGERGWAYYERRLEKTKNSAWENEGCDEQNGGLGMEAE